MVAIVTYSGKGSALTWAEGDSNFTELDTRTAVGWKNLVGTVDITGLANPPTKVSFKGFPLNRYDPDNLQECTVLFQMPHDYVSGTDIYPHGHVVTSTTSTGVIRWGFDLTYAADFDATAGIGSPNAGQIYFSPFISYVEMTMLSTYQDAHLTMSTGGGVTLPGLQADSVILMRVFRDATHVNDTYPDGVFLTHIDLYYQAQGFGTSTR